MGDHNGMVRLFATTSQRDGTLSAADLKALAQRDGAFAVLTEPRNRLYRDQTGRLQAGRLPGFIPWDMATLQDEQPLQEAWVFCQQQWHHLLWDAGCIRHVHWRTCAPEEEGWQPFDVYEQSQPVFSWRDKGRFAWLSDQADFKATVSQYFQQGRLVCWRISKVTAE